MIKNFVFIISKYFDPMESGCINYLSKKEKQIFFFFTKIECLLCKESREA